MQLSRKTLSRQRTATVQDVEKTKELIDQGVQLPDQVANWFGRLKLLYGVPINYLVPDERMLPPESIRFFYVDPNWIDALIDGAFSIGRNLTYPDQLSKDMAQDEATNPIVVAGTNDASYSMRMKHLGVEQQKVENHFKTISGFMLRSAIVHDYPGLGIDPYPKGEGPNQKNPKLLKILRLERLGKDTLICLVDGDLHRVDIHEPKEALHYGLNEFDVAAKKVIKNFRPFTINPKKPNEVQMKKGKPKPINLLEKKCLRNGDRRTIKMHALSKLIEKENNALNVKANKLKVTASEMGFEMIVGVGNVSFIKGG